MNGAYSRNTSRRPKRRRGPIVLVTVLVLLAALLVGADRGGEYLAERAAAQKMKSMLHTTQEPTVDFHGIPWLTQAVAQKFDHVTIRTQHPTIKGYQLEYLDADLYGLTATMQMKEAVADRMTGTTRVSWPYLSERTGITMSDAGDGKVRAKYPVELMGQSMEANVVAVPKLDVGRQRIEFQNPQLEVLGVPMPADLSQRVLARVVRPVDLPLPEAIRATAMSLTSDGPALSFAGDHVNLMALGR